MKSCLVNISWISQAEQALHSGMITPTLFVEEADTRHQVLILDHRSIGCSGFKNALHIRWL